MRLLIVKSVRVRQKTGFTLIELMVVVAIVGIISTMGWKMFTEQGRTNNRTDAILATTAVSLALNQFQSDNNTLITDPWPPGSPLPVTNVNAHNRYKPLVPVGIASDGSTFDITCSQRRGFRWVPANARYESCRGFYSIGVVQGVDAAGLPTYIITTTAIAGLPQANDFICNSFTLTSAGLRGHIAINDPDPQGDQPVTDQGTPANVDGRWHSTQRCWGSD